MRQRTTQRHFFFLLFPSSILTLICKDKKLTDFGVITNRREPNAQEDPRKSKKFFTTSGFFRTLQIFLLSLLLCCFSIRKNPWACRQTAKYNRLSALTIVIASFRAYQFPSVPNRDFSLLFSIFLRT